MIRMDGLLKSFGTKTVLNDVSFHFPEGERIALVGANGAGKTTLLDIITGVSEADKGSILKPPRLRMGYLPQEPNAQPMTSVIEEVTSGGSGYIQDLVRRHKAALQKMTDNYSDSAHRQWEDVDREYKQERGYALDGEARAILSGLGFTAAVMDQDPRQLSGGWRMRLELAKIFLNRPNFLILDEPTNHLDLPSLVWVERWLQNFTGTLLFVSHDRSLLRRLPTMTLHLSAGELTPYQGNFERFLEERERKIAEEAATADNLRRRREHLESFVERFGAKATKASQAQSKLKMIAKIRDLESDVVGEDSLDSMHISIPPGVPSGREVLTVKLGSIGYGKPLSQNINVLVERGQKIAVIGANGIGKSTLLKTIVGQTPALGGAFGLGHNVRFSWFAQDQLATLNLNKSVLDNVLESSAKVTQQVARNILGSLLFRGSDVDKRVGVLSGGEKARVGLARLLLQEANFLIMDEPTNHLDISSCEILTQAIQDFPGTVLFVSHDREFIDGVCTHVYAMLPDGRGQIFEGKLDDYKRQAKLSGFPDVLEPVTANPGDQKTSENSKSAANNMDAPAGEKISEQEVIALKREAQRLQKRLASLDSEISKLTAAISECDRHLETAHSDFELAATIASEKTDAVRELEKTELEWLELSESVESIKSILAQIGRSL